MDEDNKKLPKKFKLPRRLGAIKAFFDAATNLINRGVSKEGIINFAKQEFGEVSDLMLARINQLFRKKESGTLEQTRREPIEGEVIEASFRPGASKTGKIVDESPSQRAGLGKLIDETEGIEFSIPSQGIIRQKGTADEIMNYLSTNPYRKGGPLDPNTGMTRTAAREILRRLLDEGKITIPDATERDAIAKGYQGGVDPIVVFEKVFGRENLQDLSELADEMNRAGDYTELQNILKRENLYGLQQKDKYELDPGGMTDDELREFLKKNDVDPDDTGFATGGRVKLDQGGSTITLMDGTIVQIPKGAYKDGRFKDIIYSSSKGDLLREDIIRKLSFATGGRVGYSDGNDNPKKKLIKKIPRVGKIVSGIEALQPTLKKIMDRFGTKSITTADKIKQPPKKTEVLAREFEARDRDRVKKEAIEKYGITPERYDEIMKEGGKLSEESLEGEILLDEAISKFAKPKPGKMEMKGIGTITTNRDFAASLKDPKLFDPNAKNIYGDKVKTGDKFYSEMETLYTNMIARKKREMVSRNHPNYRYFQSSLRDAEDSLEAIKITRALGGNENMFDKLRTSNLGLRKGEKPIPVEFSNYVDLPDDVDPRDTILPMGEELAPKMKERFELRTKYPGLDEDIITGIVDADPDAKAQITSTLDQALELHRQGKSPEEAADIIRSTMFKGRKDNAEGGLNYLMGM